MSIKARVQGNNLKISLTGISALLSLKRSLEFPLNNVVGATFDPNAITLPKGIRIPGFHLPKIMTAGSYVKEGEKQFWLVSSGRNTVVIRLKNEKYSQLTIEVENPEQFVSSINSQIQ